MKKLISILTLILFLSCSKESLVDSYTLHTVQTQMDSNFLVTINYDKVNSIYLDIFNNSVYWTATGDITDYNYGYAQTPDTVGKQRMLYDYYEVSIANDSLEMSRKSNGKGQKILFLKK